MLFVSLCAAVAWPVSRLNLRRQREMCRSSPGEFKSPAERAGGVPILACLCVCDNVRPLLSVPGRCKEGVPVRRPLAAGGGARLAGHLPV